MPNNTEIHELNGDVETILNVGRTNDGEVYLDIRVYKTGDVIEVGDITLSQSVWDKINDKLNVVNTDQKLFRCPECGDIVTEGEILENLTTGGFGMCLCCFGNGQRTLVRYEPYTGEESQFMLATHEIELIRAIRTLQG